MGIDPDAYMAGAIPSLSRGGSWRMDDLQSNGSQYQSHQSHQGHPSRPGSGPSIYPRPSQIVPPHPTQTLPNSIGEMNLNLDLNMGNRGNFLPFHAHSQTISTTGYPGNPSSGMGSPTIRHDAVGTKSQSGGSRKAGPVRPMLVLGPAASISGARTQRGGGGGTVVSSPVLPARSANHPGWANLVATGGGGHVGTVRLHKSSPNTPTTPSTAGFIAGQATSQYGLKPSIKLRPLISPRVVEAGWD